MTFHRESLCPNGIVECEFKNHGCSSTMKRKEIRQHNDKYMKKHLSLVRGSYSRLQCNFDSLQQKVNVLSTKVEELSNNNH